jgi:hypothetical protein
MLGNGYTMNEKSLEFAVRYAKVNAFEDLTEILA